MLKKDWDDLAAGQKGDWYFFKEDTYITIRYGDDKFDVVSIPINLTGQPKPNWKWNGNKEAPTIEPSIRLLGGDGQPDRWHGWLRDGKIIDA